MYRRLALDGVLVESFKEQSSVSINNWLAIKGVNQWRTVYSLIVMKSMTKFLILIGSLHSLICHTSWVFNYSYLIWRLCDLKQALTLIYAGPEYRKALCTGTLAIEAMLLDTYIIYAFNCSFLLFPCCFQDWWKISLSRGSQRNTYPWNLFCFCFF